MAMTDPDQLRTWLGDVDFPARKEELVRRAEENGAPENVVSALMAMPPVEYGDRSEVTASVDVRDEQTDAEKADERRHHTHSGLAEQERQTSDNPIAEELGYNRKE